MQYKIKTSLDISKEEESYLRKYFPEESFQLERSLFSPGIDSTYLILNFVITSIVGGVLYDMVKSGIIHIYQKFKTKAERELVITIKHDGKLYRIKGDEVSKLGENGIYVNLNQIDDMFNEIENEKPKR